MGEDPVGTVRREDVRRALLLYAVTDRSWLREGETLPEVCRKLLENGVTMIQLREKHMPEEEMVREAQLLKPLCARYGVPLIINDSLEVCLRSGADGLHAGQSDIRGRDLRALLGPGRILGISARTVEQARAAEAAGADYLGTGAVFGTGTKQDAEPLPLETLQEICRSVSIPVVAIGGISRENLPLLNGSGAAGAAVVSALFAAPDPGAAARELRSLAERLAGNG